MEAVLTTVDLTKAYQNGGVSIHALQGVTLNIEAGEFVAVMGSSGSGKSTLLHMLGGLDSPSSGQVYLNNVRLDNLNETKRAVLRRQQIGFVFQFFNLMNNLTVADNVEMPALVAGVSVAEARRRRSALLAELGIADKTDMVPSQLSGGQKQRVALARALINKPSVLLADEPTGNLDSKSTSEVLAILKRYHENGQTIFLVTHDARVASVADRVIVMKDGQVKDDTRLESRDLAEAALSDMIQLGV